jgi:hypothetical protein
MERSVASQSSGEKLEKVLAQFSLKGPAIKRVGEKSFDLMESEFRPYKLHGEAVGSEEEFMQVAREAREERLVGMANGSVARAVGTIGDGTGYLVDARGNPINRTPQAPVTPMKRKASDW